MTAEELTKVFMSTPEMIEHVETIDDILDKLDEEDTQAVTIQVPKQFIRMLEFMERKNAADKGRDPAPVSKELSEWVVNDLHDMLHWLKVGPAQLRHYRDLWNRFCDERGAPEHKIPEPGQPEEPKEGPFLP